MRPIFCENNKQIKRQIARTNKCGYHRLGPWPAFATILKSFVQTMTTEVRNWAVVALALEAKGETSSDMYRRAKALAEGHADPMPTSFPAAPFSISAA